MTFILSMVLVLSLCLGSTKVYGEGMFTDVDKKHWAYDYVEKMVNIGLMDGYEDGTFRPNEKVNKADALVYVTRIMNIPKDEVDNMRTKYDVFLNKYNLTEERKNGLAIALSKGLVTEEFVTNNLFDNGKLNDAIKVEVCVYIVRAMGMEEEAKEKAGIFTFKDADSIPKKSRPYIRFLIDKKVLDERGDGQSKFNPNQPITRGVLAKMLSLSYDKMNLGKTPILETPGQHIVDSNDYGEIVGIIVGKVSDFILIDNGQKTDSYKVLMDTQITIDGSTATAGQLDKGMNIKGAIDKDNVLKSIKVETSNDISSGTIKTISLGASPSMVVEVADQVDTKTFYLSNETKVSIDGKDAFLFSLQEGDMVKVEALNSLAITISAESKNGEIKGILRDKKFDEEYLFVVEREDKTTYEYTIKDNVAVNRNSNKATINDLRRGDEIDISLTYGVVTSIDAKSVKGEDEGYIKAILISEEPKLTIANNKGDIISFHISKDIAVRIDKEVKDIYDLRLGYFAKLKLESDEIVSLEVEKKTDSNEPVGTVEYVNVEGMFIVLRNESTLSTSNINISSKATIKDMDGKTIALKDIARGTKLLVTGSYDRGQFVANKIIVIK